MRAIQSVKIETGAFASVRMVEHDIILILPSDVDISPYIVAAIEQSQRGLAQLRIKLLLETALELHTQHQARPATAAAMAAAAAPASDEHARPVRAEEAAKRARVIPAEGTQTGAATDQAPQFSSFNLGHVALLQPVSQPPQIAGAETGMAVEPSVGQQGPDTTFGNNGL